MTVILGRPAEPKPTDKDLAAALDRFLTTKGCPDYLRSTATTWLAANPRRSTP